MSLRDNRGFAMTLIMALLPALLGVLCLVFLGLAFVQFEMRENYLCRNQQLKTQNQVGPLLEALLELNPQAVELQTEYEAAQAELAAATASADPAGIAEASSELALIMSEKVALATQQQALIEQSNTLLEAGSAQTQRALSDQGRTFLEGLRPFLQNDFHMVPKTPPVLAVRPATTDIAPPYELVPDFENQQALVQEWQYRLRVGGPFAAFLRGQSQFDKNCAVTLRQQEEHWVAQILRDKYSSKSAW